MINKLLFKLTAGLRCRIIAIEGAPYLERYSLGKLFGVTFYLHRFVGKDAERHVHDHPWAWARSIVLAGWYEEEVVVALDINQGWISKFRIVGWYNRITEGTFHRILYTTPGTWTLFFHGARGDRSWGFLKKIEKPYVRSEQDIGTLYHQPYDMEKTVGWEKKSPLGRDVGRVPL